MGGGTLAGRRGTGGGRGPSPRGRGNPAKAARNRLALGAIPAWAGEPLAVYQPHPLIWGHPRVGGGTPWRPTRASGPSGPSPRGRGNHQHHWPDGGSAGAIPAWAGEPGRLPIGGVAKTGHPRVGGGTAKEATGKAWLPGPSPRGRGNPPVRGHRRVTAGAIPAWAGEPGSSDQAAPASGGHPRVGGGTADIGRLWIGPYGAIPAWAGEPSMVPTCSATLRGHPRVGGGTPRRNLLRSRLWGPSPRGRGNRARRKQAHLPLGAIPAWAGEPPVGSLAYTVDRGHPRVGGGTRSSC